MNTVIDLNCVKQPFADEVQPIAQDPYTADNPTNITASASSDTLMISWPADHIGWTLQAQTNGLSSGHWFDLPGSDVVNSVVIPINLANQSVFYRLRSQ
jgi:hypothetical protein